VKKFTSVVGVFIWCDSTYVEWLGCGSGGDNDEDDYDHQDRVLNMGAVLLWGQFISHSQGFVLGCLRCKAFCMWVFLDNCSPLV
jgi:hypothetical protein